MNTHRKLAATLLPGLFFAACGGCAVTVAPLDPGEELAIVAEKRDRLIANLAHVDAQQGLFGAIESRARARWKLVPAPAPNEIIVRLDKLDLRASREKEVVLAMTATMLWKDKDDPRPIMKSYEYLGPAAPLEYWIDNRDGFIARAFERGYARIADDLVGDLEGKSR